MVFPIVFKRLESMVTYWLVSKTISFYAYSAGILKLLPQAWSRM
jgi:hypothetical protein